MIVYIVRRLILLVPVLLGVTFVTFALTRIIPGNPVDRMISPMASREVREQVAEQARARMIRSGSSMSTMFRTS